MLRVPQDVDHPPRFLAEGVGRQKSVQFKLLDRRRDGDPQHSGLGSSGESNLQLVAEDEILKSQVST